jgi:hypothetical protein
LPNVCLNREAITYSKPKKNFREWRIQKARHLTTSPLYKSSTKAILFFNYFSQYYFYLSLIALAFSMKSVILIPILLFVKIIVQILTIAGASKKLAEKDLMIGSPLFELILLLIYPIFHVTKIFYKPGRWTN